LESVIVEVTFPSEEALRPFMLLLFDAPTTYGLPREVLDQGKIRVLSEAEIMDAARQKMNHCFLPGSTRVWEDIKRTSLEHPPAPSQPWCRGAA
jgi:hypothetical protein